MQVDLSWTDFKAQVISKGKLRYADRGSFYIIEYGDLRCSINKDSGADQTDFETNYKSLGNKTVESVDVDGAQILRPKAAKSGWTYLLCPIEFTTAKLNSISATKYDNSNRAGITYKIYDSNDVEITTSQNEGSAVKTVIDFEPSFDYEIIGGHLQQHTKPTSNIRLWIVGVPDISEQSGGSKEMVGGINLKFIDPSDKVNADGRVSKYMKQHQTLHTNKLRMILRHDAGVQHEVMMILEMFKE